MHCATAHTADSLDRRYLEFTARTSRIFAQLPEIEPLRHFIFKELLIQRNADRGIETVKHWLRPMLRRGTSRGTLTRADVLIWVESCREVIVDALLPVYRTLVARGIKVQLAWSGGPANLPSSTLDFRYPARAVAPAWAKNAWEALCDEIEELRDRSLEQTFSYACANNQGLLDEVNRVLEVVQPKVVLCAATNFTGGGALVSASRSRGALTLLLQHGITQAFYTPVIADYMLTWGESSNETLIGLGVPGERLLPLGSPRHDSFLPSINDRAQLRLALSLPEKPIFVFFSNGNDLVRNGNAPVECAAWLEGMASDYSNRINVVVRLHPNEDGSLYRECPHLHITKGVPDLATTLQGCDWSGSLCSTVLYEALLYQKPVWQFYADGWPELANNWTSGLATRVSSQTELGHFVSRLLSEGPNGFIPDDIIGRVFSNHGRAAEAIADFVHQRLQERATRSDPLTMSGDEASIAPGHISDAFKAAAKT